MDRAMNAIAQPLLHLRPRRRTEPRRQPGTRDPQPRRRPSTRLLAVALLPGAAAGADAVPAIDAGQAQARLVHLGLLPEAAATGAWNASTVDAVRRFQADRGLEPSGVAGAATAGRLLAA
jgi:peptidoglycan hydrolase-like protein with peptidoglycan-binding domain